MKPLPSLLAPVLLFLFVLPAFAADYKEIEFKSEDGLKITADLYKKHKKDSKPFIVFCHQANWSRGEYREIAPKLNKLGFNCMAIDQRSGGAINGVNNETAARAKAAGKPTNYPDARQDIIAALKYARKNYAKGKLILWGSSYSSALVLQIAGSEPKLVDGVLSFAPGEYFGRFGKPGDWVTQSASKIACPAFITSAQREGPQWKAIYAAIPGNKKMSFLPTTEGQHGSRALWEKFPDNDQYWKAVKAFLGRHFKTK
ncbi:MAG: alpha/beta fold hydrolase [Planctomycetota bacterium]